MILVSPPCIHYVFNKNSTAMQSVNKIVYFGITLEY